MTSNDKDLLDHYLTQIQNLAFEIEDTSGKRNKQTLERAQKIQHAVCLIKTMATL